MGITPLETQDIFASTHDIFSRQLKWKKGVQPDEPASALAFLAPILPLFFALEVGENFIIRDYPIIAQFWAWVAYIIDEHPNVLDVLKISRRQRAIIEAIVPKRLRSLISLIDLPVINPAIKLAPKAAAKAKRPRDDSPPIKVEKGAEPSKAKRGRLRSPVRSRVVLSPSPEPIVLSDHDPKTSKKPAAKPKPRPSAPKGAKKAAPTGAASSSSKDSLLPSLPISSPTNDSALAPAFQTLPSSAASIYSIIAPKSALITDPEAALKLTSVNTSTALPRMPCWNRACMENPLACIPYDGNSRKCAPCQQAHSACSFQRHRDDTLLHNHLQGFWDLVQGPCSTASESFVASFASEDLCPSSKDVNCLYDRLSQEWRHLHDLTALVNHQATHVESTRRFLSSYLQTLKHNNDPFVNEIVDLDTLRTLIQQHPGAVYEQMCAVAPLPSYFQVASGRPDSPPLSLPLPEGAAALAGQDPPEYQGSVTPTGSQQASLPFGFGVPPRSVTIDASLFFLISFLVVDSFAHTLPPLFLFLASSWSSGQWAGSTAPPLALEGSLIASEACGHAEVGCPW
ncbi:hypothetical protein H1R20_g11411, partial [Candolleomyces eurysporus]